MATMTRTLEIEEGELLYHAVHGLCRMDEVIEQGQSGKKVRCYSLVPQPNNNKMKTRFVIEISQIEVSGFHPLVSLDEANKILDYLKPSSPKKVTGQNQTWELAQAILTFSQDAAAGKDQRKRQMLHQSVKGLLGELAYVMKLNLKDTAAKIQKSLGNSSKVHPLVATALEQASED